MIRRADVLVIGGGIAGMSLAAALRGRVEVIVVEGEPRLFHHASSRSAQQMQPTYGSEPVRRLTAASIPMVAAMGRRREVSVFTPRPLLWLHYEDARDGFEQLLRSVDGLDEIGVGDAVRRLPTLSAEGLEAVAIDEAAVEVDVPLLLEAYRDDALRQGVEVVPRARVDSAHRIGPVWRVRAGGEHFEAPIVVDAAGAWADEVAAVFGAARRGLVPRRRTVAISAAGGRTVDRTWPMALDAGGRFYFRPWGDEVLVSPLEDEASVPEDAAAEVRTARLAVDRVNAVTDLELGAPRRMWTGLRTLSPDERPVVGFDDRVEGLFWLAGQGGWGIQTSAALAETAAAALLGVRHDVDGLEGVLEELAPARFTPSVR